MSYMTTPDDHTMCNECGALVRHRAAHDEFHEDIRKQLEEIRQLASSAFAIAQANRYL